MDDLRFDKIDSESVVSNVVNQISSLIIERHFNAGDKIPTEMELASRLGVSRNSIREAIKILRTVGVLEVLRGKGTFVTTTVSPTFFDPLIFSLILEPSSNKDLYELRMMFDSMVLFCAVNRITVEQIATLKMMIKMTEASFEKNNEDSNTDYYILQDITFHKYLLETTRNPLIQRIGYSILEFIPEYVRRSIEQEHGVERSIKNHKEIIRILESKDLSKIIDITDSTLAEWKNNWQEEN